ncbi:hypothetical protein R1flu_025957 [Riccia fluitans]|uniref:Uncharacterized protein n=1 Tax=Riccia fluitans TaxID=41844 RepID=A0ABD1XEC1_9MARC
MLMVMATSILCIQLALEQDNLVPPLELLKLEDMHMIDVEAEDDPMRMWALALQVASTVIGRRHTGIRMVGHTYFHVGDRFGLGESTIQELMEEVIQAIITMFSLGFQLKPYLLGDGEYAMERWLMIPYHIVPSSPDLHVSYNARHTAVGFRASGSSTLGANHAKPGDSGGEVRTELAECVALTPWEG